MNFVRSFQCYIIELEKKIFRSRYKLFQPNYVKMFNQIKLICLGSYSKINYTKLKSTKSVMVFFCRMTKNCSNGKPNKPLLVMYLQKDRYTLLWSTMVWMILIDFFCVTWPTTHQQRANGQTHSYSLQNLLLQNRADHTTRTL